MDVGLESVATWLTEANKFRTYTIIIPGSHEKHKKRQQERKESLLRSKKKIEKTELEKWSDHKRIEKLNVRNY